MGDASVAADSSRFSIASTPLAGVKRITRRVLEDHRGVFARLYCQDELRAIGVEFRIQQINHSLTRQRGMVRGLHFQRPPHMETKLVSCVAGSVFDVALDLRQGSPTFMHWFGCTLSAARGDAVLIPAGFAHGFQALEDDSELIYLHDVPYEPQSQAGVNPQDPMLIPGPVAFPLPVIGMSAQDEGRVFLEPHFKGVAP